VGKGMQVLMLEFLKGSCHYGELDAVRAFGEKFVMKQMGRGFVKVGAERPILKTCGWWKKLGLRPRNRFHRDSGI
jgi:ATP:corrinoid adenosyltransferase